MGDGGQFEKKGFSTYQRLIYSLVVDLRSWWSYCVSSVCNCNFLEIYGLTFVWRKMFDPDTCPLRMENGPYTFWEMWTNVSDVWPPQPGKEKKIPFVGWDHQKYLKRDHQKYLKSIFGRNFECETTLIICLSVILESTRVKLLKQSKKKHKKLLVNA